jgi:chaperone BCS1
MDYIDSTKSHVSRLILFNNIKTGDPIIDAFLVTIVLSIFSWFTSWVYDNYCDRIFTNFSLDDIKCLFYKKNTVIIEGKRIASSSPFTYSCNISSAYSDKFKAVWNYILLNIEKNKTIYKIRESHTNYNNTTSNSDRRKNIDMYIVYQNKHFLLDKNIYVKAEIEHESDNNKEEKYSIKTDKVTINIYSYKLSLPELINYIDNITNQYLLTIKNNRFNKKFIYTYHNGDNKDKDEDSKYDSWREDLFESTRTFKNIFFDGKKQLIDKIDFFLENKNWYYEKGIPYTLGIGLHGPPGTGKTSFIKALANYTNRHIIVLSLKFIKTKNQLEKMFFENTYNDNNECNSISWDKKIFVFEDIDCIGDIILSREEKNKKQNNKNPKKINNKTWNKYKNDNNKNYNDKNYNDKNYNDKNTIKVGDIIQSICNSNETQTVSILQEKQITLDDILNLWDGIRETPGRILIISSNHYDKLDPALVRPGRIDITHELCNASHNTISEIYSHLFNNKIDDKDLKKIHDKFYSPAEIINMYVSNKDEKQFLNRLKQNKKIN